MSLGMSVLYLGYSHTCSVCAWVSGGSHEMLKPLSRGSCPRIVLGSLCYIYAVCVHECREDPMRCWNFTLMGLCAIIKVSKTEELLWQKLKTFTKASNTFKKINSKLNQATLLLSSAYRSLLRVQTFPLPLALCKAHGEMRSCTKSEFRDVLLNLFPSSDVFVGNLHSQQELSYSLLCNL